MNSRYLLLANFQISLQPLPSEAVRRIEFCVQKTKCESILMLGNMALCPPDMAPDAFSRAPGFVEAFGSGGVFARLARVMPVHWLPGLSDDFLPEIDVRPIIAAERDVMSIPDGPGPRYVVTTGYRSEFWSGATHQPMKRPWSWLPKPQPTSLVRELAAAHALREQLRADRREDGRLAGIFHAGTMAYFGEFGTGRDKITAGCVASPSQPLLVDCTQPWRSAMMEL